MSRSPVDPARPAAVESDLAPSGLAPATKPLAAPPTAPAEAPLPAKPVPAWMKLLRPPEAPGELGRLADYRVLRVLGEGGMGLVFEAEDVSLGRRLALKVMQPDRAEADVARKRFLREARAVAALEHEHVVPVYRAGEDRGVLFLAMPLLVGESLADRLNRDGPLPLVAVASIARQAAEGLAAAHARGLIHRDIKPANVFLERAPGKPLPRVKLLDFGLARDVSGGHSVLTQAGVLIGTPGYMAPEQARGAPVDARGDLFSLGCVMYVMASGREPFQGDSPAKIVRAIVKDSPTPLARLRRDVPPPLADLVGRLLAKAPADRPASAAAVAAELAAVEALANTEWDAAPATVPLAPATPRPESPGHTPADTPADALPPPAPDRAAGEAGPPAGVCPECANELRALGGKRWCLRCGRCLDPDPSTAESDHHTDSRAAPMRRGLLVVGLVTAAAAAVLAAAYLLMAH